VSSPPSGTVTFLLADVEGSTALQQNAQVDYPVVIGRIRDLLRSALSGNGGHEVDAVGDELLAAFTEHGRAVDAALEAQRAMRDAEWPEDVSVRVRIGLHTGTPSIGVEGYTGVDVVRASRIANAGHGGQIVFSAATLEACGHVPHRDLGEHQLEGLPEPVRVYQLLADDLPRDFPPLRKTIATLGNSITVVLADDTVLLREGVARLLGESGFDVVAQSGNAEDLLRHVAMHKPQVAIVDIRMPPTHTDEGLRAAREIRERFPGTGVLVLSQYVESAYALDLLSESAEGVGYLLKDRVADVEQFASAVRRVAEGGSALDPAVVSELVGRRRQDDPLDELTPREREVLDLMAEGRSNQAIADRLYVTLRAIEKHVTSIFSKLDLPASTDDHRRVLAVLLYLRS
jgi:DNA-binding NarL/FixJ family response regulator/class 3 adenylate cyclase